VKRNLSKQ